MASRARGYFAFGEATAAGLSLSVFKPSGVRFATGEDVGLPVGEPAFTGEPVGEALGLGATLGVGDGLATTGFTGSGLGVSQAPKTATLAAKTVDKMIDLLIDFLLNY